MESGWSVEVVVPAKNEAPFIRKVIETIPELVDCIIVVNDGSTDATHEEIHAANTHAEVIEIQLDGEGVGAAIDAGHQAMLEQFEGPFVSVVMAGDGQMDPTMIQTLIGPIQRGEADYAKANRFYRLKGLAKMPLLRLVGNLLLSFVSKMSSGYWKIFDPTNGFTAISALQLLTTISGRRVIPTPDSTKRVKVSKLVA